ncbi:MAG: hypothetical protein SOW25_03675 [Helicobacter sp.]|nr:hypothetical protein [Helicobacteraceae bacterium]MDY3113411.1 hypothetical protein [Helicobacter sp.]
MDISILDCTLRDGVHVNGGDFGESCIKSVISALDSGKVEIIEVGFLRDCAYKSGSSVYSCLEDFENILNKNVESQISLMIRAGEFKAVNLRKSPFVDIIRVAFYKNELEDAKGLIKSAKNLGYKVAANPINIGVYDKNEIVELLGILTKMPLDIVSIVDTFGMFRLESFKEICEIFMQKIPPQITLGLHLHENFSLTLGLVASFLADIKCDRSVIIDASLYGMGRIPGNLCTELLADYLNQTFDKNYNLSPLLDVIYKEIEPFKLKNPWGYNPAYLLSASKGVHRDYAELLNKRRINYKDMDGILNEIKDSNKHLRFDKEFIESLLKEWL